ncbi:hypothetical protein AVEN_203491-1 [Araneus ventricosus]|uniref:Uncharacterized protein n=1 Tax=Araneus ventricosus TaxID=182803 RepID=A0A4Y2BGJ0_ARAVE|nr:hypothetical protein AVEN_203491-1 [Araneus ventricosus]
MPRISSACHGFTDSEAGPSAKRQIREVTSDSALISKVLMEGDYRHLPFDKKSLQKGIKISQPFSMKWPSGVPWCMTTTWSTTYVVEECDVMWKLPHPMLTGGFERQLRKLTFGIDLSNYNVG